MAFCKKCGTELQSGVKFCPKCGASSDDGAAANNVSQVLNTPDSTGDYDQNDINDNKVMAVLAYFGLLFLIPLLAAPKSKFARFHANQGLVLFIFEVALGIVLSILTAIVAAAFYYSYAPYLIVGAISWIIYIALGIIAILGIVHAAQGKAKELPIIGKIKIIK